MRSLALALISHGKIKTTEAKARELRPYVEKLITHGKTSSLHGRRLMNKRLRNARESKKVIDEISPKYTDRKGGYTRIIKLPIRKSDGSKMAVIEFV